MHWGYRDYQRANAEKRLEYTHLGMTASNRKEKKNPIKPISNDTYHIVIADGSMGFRVIPRL